MQHCSFPEVCPASRRPYQPWITLMNTLPLLQLTTTLSQSRLPLLSAKKLSTVIMTKQIIRKFSGSLWVCNSYLFNCKSIYYPLLVLHPRHKLQYFKHAGWQDDWIERAEEIVRTQFDLSYGSLDTSWATTRQNVAKDKVRTPYTDNTSL
jgi:hypothetical protein